MPLSSSRFSVMRSSCELFPLLNFARIRSSRRRFVVAVHCPAQQPSFFDCGSSHDPQTSRRKSFMLVQLQIVGSGSRRHRPELQVLVRCFFFANDVLGGLLKLVLKALKRPLPLYFHRSFSKGWIDSDNHRLLKQEHVDGPVPDALR